MEIGADRKGPGITCAGDMRVTCIGKVLRRFKLDELPQLWNVLMGDMSLVGPRPELLRYVMNYSPSDQLVLRVRPGITDFASIAFRREEALLARALDPEQFYRTTILPKKLALNADYIGNISFHLDIFLMFKTLWKVVEFRS